MHSNKKDKNFELYSFDIFDTIVTRKVATPKGVFALMQESLIRSQNLPEDFCNKFYSIRTDAETFVRKYKKQTLGHREIVFDDIYNHIQEKYSLTEEQIDYLKNLELETEIENIIGIDENINKIKELVNLGQRVILISDMYFSETDLHKILSKVDNIFDNIKIYASSEYKTTKYNTGLYKIVQKQEGVRYKNWKHTGDNKISDIKSAKKLGIKTVLYDRLRLMQYEKDLLNLYPDNLSFQKSIGISKLLRLNKQEHNQDKYNFGSSYSAPVLYNYVSEILKTALDKDFKTLYFIARDGYIPKLIADIIIKTKNLPIKTKYIYGSRLAWRIPNEKNYEYFINITFKEYQNKLSLKFLAYRLGISEEDLIKYVRVKSQTAVFSKKQREKIQNDFLCNKELRNFVLESFSLRKQLLMEYLKQNIDFNESNIAFVDINGTGKTQVILEDYINKIKPGTVYTFYMTVSPEIGKTKLKRFVFCEKPRPFSTAIELICRTNYGQTLGYKENGSKIEPILEEFNDEAIVKWGYNEHLQGILDFAETTANCKEDLSNKELFYIYFDYLTQKCDKETAALLGDVPYLLIGSEKKVIKAAPELSVWQFLSHLILRKDLAEYSQCPDLSYARGNKVINFIKYTINKFDFLKNFLIELRLFLLLKSLKSNKIAFWGASIFLENFIKKWNINSENILGIIDKNNDRHGQMYGKYKIYPPEELDNLKPNYVIMTIKNRHQRIYKELTSTFEECYKEAILAPDIFDNTMNSYIKFNR